MNVIEITAYHEAGHCVLAYCLGWKVEKVELKLDDLGRLLYGGTVYDFGEEREIIDSIYNSDELLRDELTKKRWVAIAYRRQKLALGGITSEQLYFHEKEMKFELTEAHSGDKDVLQRFYTFLKKNDPDFKANFPALEWDRTEKVLEQAPFQKAIFEISNCIITKHAISGVEIEKIIDSNKLYECFQ